ncbi:ankyrin repeat domain-containing protein 50-like [Mytilus edulis]|uniref:ankyrin repeat domain-containing protein 50-like n=1 Tax=Mytilus edulis TaxID=6550 RepID=UPI0039EEDF54
MAKLLTFSFKRVFFKQGEYSFQQRNITYFKRCSWTALHIATFRGFGEEIARLLLEHGANVNLQDGSGDASLHLAARRGDLGTIRFLLLHTDIDPDLKNKCSRTAFHITTSRGFEEATRILLEHGANVNLQDEENKTALHGAVLKIDIVKLLLDHGANVNLQDKCSRTALHIVTADEIVKNTEEITGLLLEHGANVNLQDKMNRTALHGAVWNVNIVKLLLDHGATVNVQDRDYQTALSIITGKRKKRNIWPFTDRFLEHGAYDNLHDESNGTALNISAMERRNLDILDLLLEHGASVYMPYMFLERSVIPTKRLLWTVLEEGFVEMAKTLLIGGAMFTKDIFRFIVGNRNIHINNKIVLCDMFIADGFPITEYDEPKDKTPEDMKLFEHIQKRKFETLSLSSISRICIRYTLINANKGCAIKSKIAQLDLPNHLQVYIERLQL